MLDVGTLGASLGGSAVTAGVMSVVLWYKLGRIDQKLADLPCSNNGINYTCMHNKPTNNHDAVWMKNNPSLYARK